MFILISILSLYISHPATTFAGFSPLSLPPSLCGTDERMPSNAPQFGRAVETADQNIGCSVTMIGKSCFISAGHCTDYLKFIQFNVPATGEAPQAQDIYPVDPVSVVSGTDSDWSVAKLLVNTVTGKEAGIVQGFLKISNALPKTESMVSITGYGSSDKGFVQQMASGKIINVTRTQLEYQVDTMPGNSGSSVIDLKTGKIIGIHTNGGCSDSEGNLGTLIYGNSELEHAIANCLDSEKKEL